MTEFISERTEVSAKASVIYDFLNDFTNFEHLMPDQIKNWKADQDHCSFTIEGMADLSMKIASRNPHSNIHIEADGKNPIDYTLDIFIFEKMPGCDVEIVFRADLNPFVKMMAAKPLQNFVDLLAQKLQTHFK